MEIVQMRTFCGDDVAVDGLSCVRAAEGQRDFLLVGPHEERETGVYSAEFHVAGDAGPDVLGDPLVSIVQVVCNDGRSVIAERFILLSHIDRGLTRIALTFVLHEKRKVEYRVWSEGRAPVTATKQVAVSSVRRPAHAPSATSAARIWKNEREFLDGYLRNVTGVLHVGASTGQERRYYWLLGLDVIWVEAIKEIYEELVDNVAIYDRQRPINALLADRDGRTFDFKIANNKGASSSILDLEDHEKIFPGIHYIETRSLTAVTLETLMQREGISTTSYQALTLDVEGAELMILQGAQRILQGFQYIKCEVADFPARRDTPTVKQLDDILKAAGFAQLIRRAFANGPDNKGTYWDIVWKRALPGVPLNEPGLSLPFVAHPQDVEGIEKMPG